MTRLEALQALAEEVEAGGFIDDTRGIGEINYEAQAHLITAFNGSLDAAKALHDAVLPGWVVNSMDQAANLAGDPWGVEVAYFDGSRPSNNRKAYSGHDYADPARAWLLAILKALIAREQAKGDE